MSKTVRLLLSLALLFTASFSAFASSDRPLPAAEEPQIQQIAAPPTGPETIAALDLPRVPVDVATRIAEQFLAETAATSRPEWLGARVDAPTLFVSASRKPVLYEFPVYAGGLALGALTVGATEGLSSVTSYTTEGQSMAANLRDKLREKTGVAAGASGAETFYYGGVGRFGITVAAPDADSGDLRDDTGRRLFAYAADTTIGSWAEWSAYFEADIRVSNEFVDAEREVRSSYLDGGKRLAPQATASLRVAANAHQAIGGGIGGFAHYYQENRKWSNGTCYAGCSPVAAAILLQYWDRNGYPGLISSPQDNDNWYVTDGDVRWTIDELRKRMGTTCTSTSEGSTSIPSIGTGLQSYITSRGAKLRASNTSFLMWWNVISEINAGHPTLLHFRLSNKAGHSAVIYEYTDNWFTNNDWVCVANGWTGQPWNCYNVTSPSEPWWAITRVYP